MTNELRAGLPPLPDRMRSLPVDERGYPVPHFVAWVDGKPDHRIMDAEKLPGAVRHERCWMCGQPLGQYKSFCIGPMCSITRTISEPPSHLDCLRFAVTACPFLTRPRAHRRDANMPEEVKPPAGMGIPRNPGAVCIWTVRGKPKIWSPPGGGILFELADPVSTEWYAEGRPARRSEVNESIRSGLHLLVEQAVAEDKERPGAGAMADLAQRIAREAARLDAQEWPPELKLSPGAAWPFPERGKGIGGDPPGTPL